MMTVEKIVLDRVNAFVAATRTTPSQFGLEAMNDAKVIPQLEDGRRIRDTTVEKLYAHMVKVKAEIDDATAWMSEMLPPGGSQQ